VIDGIVNEKKRCWAEIDVDALRGNVAVARQLGGGRAGIMAIVKANAYGHGLMEVAAALSGGVEMFGVANVAEAQTLRQAVPQAKIFILGAALPWEREEIVRAGFIPCLSSLDEARLFDAIPSPSRLCAHVAVDTGMGRMGVWQDEAVETIREMMRLPHLEISGIATHLPVADEDDQYTAQQIARFEKIVEQLRASGLQAPVIHSHNSAGVIRFGNRAGGIVRAGLMIYGVSPVPGFQDRLRPVMTLKTRVILVREVAAGRNISYGRTFITPRPMRVATLAVGYADGYPRTLSNHNAAVLIQGRRCPVLGRVTMDQTMVDVTDLHPVAPGDEVVLIGRQGDEEIPALELAGKAGTIVWEIFTGIKGRVERIYLQGEESSARN